jgi:hypothetical protein
LTQITTPGRFRFVLDFDNPLNNFFVIPVKILQHKETKKSKVRQTKITLTFPGIDARDQDEGRFEGQIIEGGRAIQVKMPVIPHFWLKYVKSISSGRKKKGVANDQDKDAHQTLATKVVKQTPRTMDVIFELPGGMMVSNKNCN